jgi:exonuclease VII large subunit
VIVLLLASGLILFRVKYRKSITQLAETQIRNSTSDLINDAIDKQIELGNIQYDRMVFFEKDLNGKITALKTNMSEVNRLKTNILNIINDEILRINKLAVCLDNLIENKLNNTIYRVDIAINTLDKLNPIKLLRSGYSVVSKENDIINVDNVNIDDIIDVRLEKAKLKAKVIEKTKLN